MSQRPLRIGIMARGLDTPAGGVKEYLFEIVRALSDLDTPHRIIVYHARREFLGTFPAADEVALTCRGRLRADHLEIPRRAARDRLDVLFCPKHIVPPLTRVPAVVAIYDLAYYRLVPEIRGEYPTLEALYMRALMPLSVRRARAVVTLSEHTRDDIVRRLRVPAAKIAIVPPAVSNRYRPVERSAAEATAQRLGARLPYIFYAGALSPRKNPLGLLRAFRLLKDRLPHALVLTAGKSWHDREARRMIGEWGLAERVCLLGHVDAADMPALYSAADVFVYPSLYEGYGLPVLEAMACGCPVVASNATSVPEAAGGAARLADPRRPGEIARQIERLIDDRALRQSCIEAGKRRVTELDWAASAKKLLAVLVDAAR